MATYIVYSLHCFSCKVCLIKMIKKESLWDIAVKQNSLSQLSNGGEKTLIFAGSKRGGKSTIVQRFLDRNEVVKESLALEYNFARKSGRSLTKETCHVWELGGGTLFQTLLDLYLGKSNTTLILVLDLSAPESLWNVMESILNYVYNFYKKREDQTEHIGKVPKEGITPFPMPLVIIGAKYDKFQSFDMEKRKIMYQTLRSVAHSLDASLMFYSDKDATLHKKLKDILHYHGFGGSNWKGHCTEFDKPLLICAGNDSYEEIGVSKNSLPVRTRGLYLDSFKHSYTVVFPQVSERMNIPDDPAKDQNFREPLIDSLRSQKDDELDRFLQESGQRKKVTSGLAF